ncbi:MAG: hypothetical protein M0Q90_09855 [Bacteroidales bacterium]|nr:hypothetical protein [Bacteroidales bacterium]
MRQTNGLNYLQSKVFFGYVVPLHNAELAVIEKMSPDEAINSSNEVVSKQKTSVPMAHYFGLISELLTFRELYCRTNKVFKDKSGFSPANIFRYGVEPTELYFRILYPFL